MLPPTLFSFILSSSWTPLRGSEHRKNHLCFLKRELFGSGVRLSIKLVPEFAPVSFAVGQDWVPFSGLIGRKRIASQHSLGAKAAERLFGNDVCIFVSSDRVRSAVHIVPSAIIEYTIFIVVSRQEILLQLLVCLLLFFACWSFFFCYSFCCSSLVFLFLSCSSTSVSLCFRFLVGSAFSGRNEWQWEEEEAETK